MEEELRGSSANTQRLRKWLYLASAAVLVIGVVSSVLIYLAAANEEASDSGYEIIGGFVYPGGGAYNKKYIHDLQLYGGNAAMLADRFNRWFFGLWHGTTLAYTVVVIAVFLSLVLFILARNAQHLQSDTPGEGSRDQNA